MAKKEIGMDQSQEQKDRGGYHTSIEMVTGGMSKGYDEGGSTEVGNENSAGFGAGTSLKGKG
jgi:hypothetical protein